MTKPDFAAAIAHFAVQAERRYARIEAVIAQRDRLEAQWVQADAEGHSDEYRVKVLKLVTLIERLRDAVDCPFPDEHEVDAALDAVEAQLKILE